MKTAICISGHLRHYKKLKENFNFFKNAIKTFSQVDIFVAAWDRQNTLNSWSHAHGESNAETVKNKISQQEVKDFYETDFVELFDYDFYSSDYSPINYKNLTDKIYNWDSRGIGGNVINSSKMFFLIYESNKLKKKQEYVTNQNYDIVIRTRPDYEYVNLKSINNLEIKENEIYFGANSEKIDDQFILGNSKSMDKVCSIFLKHSIAFNSNCFGNPENILYNTLINMHSISLKIIPKIGQLGSDVTDSKR